MKTLIIFSAIFAYMALCDAGKSFKSNLLLKNLIKNFFAPGALDSSSEAVDQEPEQKVSYNRDIFQETDQVQRRIDQIRRSFPGLGGSQNSIYNLPSKGGSPCCPNCCPQPVIETKIKSVVCIDDICEVMRCRNGVCTTTTEPK